MKHLVALIIIIFFGPAKFFVFGETPAKKYIRYTERVRNEVSSFENHGLPPKTDRVSCTEGNIILFYESPVPDSIEVALEAAKKIWAVKVPVEEPVYFEIIFESLGEGISMYADVLCMTELGLEGCPCALASQIKGQSQGSFISPDARIVFNSDIEWNCSFSSEATSTSNLPTIAMRGLARCLGFGTSILQDTGFENSFFYSFDKPSYYDRLLYRGNLCLASIDCNTPAFAEFLQCEDVYIKTDKGSYKIYAPSVYEQDMSLCYFDENNSLMSYSFSKGNVNLSIDEKTENVLRTLGWNIEKSEIEIISSDISANGLGSSYTSHTFSLAEKPDNVSGYHWKFLLKDKTGTYTQISTGTSDFFTISEISSPDDYFVNINGDLEGRIECEYTMNGELRKAKPFALSLELKPIIKSIGEVLFVDEGPFEFSLNFNVQYSGADELYLEIEEEYDSTIRRIRFDEPYIAHVKTGAITNLYYSWVTVVVMNKYGTASQTMEYAPIYDYASKPDVDYTKNFLSSASICHIQIFSIDGKSIFEGNSEELVNAHIEPGIYVKKETYEDGTQKINKVLLK